MVQEWLFTKMLIKLQVFFEKLGVKTLEAFRAFAKLLKKGAKWVKKEYKKLKDLLKKMFGKLGKNFKKIEKKFLNWFKKHRHSKTISKELKEFGKYFRGISHKLDSSKNKLGAFGVKMSKHLSSELKQINKFFGKKGCKCKFNCSKKKKLKVIHLKKIQKDVVHVHIVVFQDLHQDQLLDHIVDLLVVLQELHHNQLLVIQKLQEQ